MLTHDDNQTRSIPESLIASTGGKRGCLLIEDDADTAQYICNGLKETGFAVTWCRDSASGLQTALNGHWDIVILDRMLPGVVDGLSIVQALREIRRPAPVLVLVADAAQGTQRARNQLEGRFHLGTVGGLGKKLV